ncbi:MAG: FAD-dependent oxidoreductase [Solobacterium sp.]|nr:FAD-dependent oxidoreductase [Solobacterium sp.]
MEKYVMADAERVPVYREADVVVVGGGIAGIAAAVAAARQGKKTVLLEKNSALGGLATLGHVCIYLPLDDGRGHRVASGLAEELLYTSIRYSYNTMAPQWKFRTAYAEHPQGRYETTFNIPAAILAYDELCEEEGVETIFDVVFSEPIMNGSRVEGVIVESKQGRVAVLGKQFVDASGDADLMARAGADTSTKDSICSHWAYETSTETAKEALAEGKGVVDMMQLRLFGARPHGGDLDAYPVPTFSGTTIDGVNGYLKTSRRMARDYLKENFSDDYCMLTLPTMAQFRTSRHITGVETLDYESDAERYRDDSIGIISNGIGGPVVEPYEYPYGGLIDRRIENVYAAGRTVACDEKMGWEMMRLIPACALTGEAAGTAAAQAIDQNATAQTLDITKLQEVLAAANVIIHIPEEMKGNASQPTTVEADPRYQHKTHIRFSSAELNAGFKKMY